MTKSLMYRHILFFIVVCGLVTLNLWVNAKQEYFDNRVKVIQNGVIQQKKIVPGNCSLENPCDDLYFKINDKYTRVIPEVYAKYKVNDKVELVRKKDDAANGWFEFLTFIVIIADIVSAVAIIIFLIFVITGFIKWISDGCEGSFIEFLQD